MKYLFTILLLLSVTLSCKKHSDPPPAPFHPIDTINNLSISCSRSDGWVEANNRINFFSFNRNVLIHGIGFQYNDFNYGSWCHGCGGDTTSHRCYIKYVGTVPLLKSDSVNYRGPYTLNYMAPKAILSKPVFEAHYVSNDSLYKTYVFADSGSIVVSFYYPDTARIPRWFLPPNLSNDSITHTFLDLLLLHQTNPESMNFTRLP